MPKKQRLDSRLKKLFSEIQPAEAPSKPKRTEKVPREAPPPAPDLKPVAALQPVATQPRPVKRHTSALPPLPSVTRGTEEGGPSSMALTFQSGQQEWATLQIVDETAPRVWSQDERLLVKQVADQLALALENARLYQETLDRADELSALNRIISSTTHTLDLNQLLDTLLHQVLDVIGFSGGLISLVDESTQTLVLATHHNMPDPVLDKLQTNGLAGTPCDHVYQTKKLFWLNDLREGAPVDVSGLIANGIFSYLGVPIEAKGRILGTLCTFNQTPGLITERKIDLTRAVGIQIGFAIENANLFQRTERSEGELRALFAAMSDVIIVYDKEGRYVRIAPSNPSQLFKPPEELLGKKISEVLPTELHKPFMEVIRKALMSNMPERIEYPLAIGVEKYWFDASVTRLNDQQVFWVARDITERKTAEEASRKFQLGIEHSDDAVFIMDMNGTIEYVNPGFEKIYGYRPDEAIGQTSQILEPSLVPPEQYKRFWETLLSGGTVTGEITNKAKDGRLIAIAGTHSPILDEQGHPLGFLAVHHDMTETKRAEEAVRRRNEYLAVTAEIGRLVTSTLDLNTIFKRTVDLVTERFDFYHAAIFIVEETGFIAVLREATGPAGAEMKNQKHALPVDSKSIVGKVTSEGTPVVVNNTALDSVHRPNPLLPETRAEAAIPLRVGNRIIGALDIQSRKVDAFSEDEISVLQTLADQVAVAIDNARSYELSQQAVKEMREIDKLKSQFLANMSHELRTPLNSIIGFSRVILKGIDGPVTELQGQDLTAIYNSGQHLLGLINDILDLSKIEAGKMELSFDEVNITDVVNGVLSTIPGLIKDKPITLRRNIQPDLPSIWADAIRVRQVMINLLSNAAKFTEEGEITVDVGIKPGPTGRQELMISVADTGPGISQADQPKLFQAFTQVDTSPTRKTGGSGLGLSICQHLIQMHGGRIGIHSTVGQGSTFYFTLPLYRRDSDGQASSPGGKVVLAIDDDPQVIGLYERYLQPQGYQIVSLTDPSRAVERVRQLKPFAVTLDIMMPGIDGWQVLTNLKADPETRSIPIVICSIVEDQEKGFSLGAADYLVKPILEDDLIEALNRLNADGSIREVLVIDDNPDDLRLLGKMLVDDGHYRPVLAKGGPEGWKKITSNNPPQAVILDLFMPELDGFRILENLQADVKLRDLPVIVISGIELTAEQQKTLSDFGQRLLTKGMFSEKELLASLQRALDRVRAG